MLGPFTGMSRAEHAPPLREGRWLEERLSINIYRYRQAEVLQYCRRDVDDSRLIRIDWPAVLRYVAAGLVMAAVLWMVGLRPGQLFAGSTLALLSAVPLGAAAYFGALAAIGGFGRREVAFIASLFRGAPALPRPASS